MSPRPAAIALRLTVASLAASADALRVGTITIHVGAVFSDAEAAQGSVYRLADKLHAETRPSVIRKFLLFKEGETYDPARLAATERNLRALGFLRAVSATADPPPQRAAPGHAQP